jgi:hypothetical protein
MNASAQKYLKSLQSERQKYGWTTLAEHAPNNPEELKVMQRLWDVKLREDAATGVTVIWPDGTIDTRTDPEVAAQWTGVTVVYPDGSRVIQ